MLTILGHDPLKTERRRQTRYVFEMDAFAALGSRYAKVGKIRDISETGLAFDYIEGQPADDDDSSVCIFILGNSLYFQNVPCDVVYDVDVQAFRGGGLVLAPLIQRRCGVRFADLSEVHKEKLRLFIEFCAFNNNTEYP